MLLGPLPEGLPPRVTPVGEASPDPDSPVRGWKSLLVEVGAGGMSYRIVQVLIDAGGSVLSASDHVLYRRKASESPLMEIEQHSIGGRFETDGGFRGTCWQVEGVEPEEGKDPDWKYTPRPPSEQEVTGLRAVVAEVLFRHESNGHPG